MCVAPKPVVRRLSALTTTACRPSSCMRDLEADIWLAAASSTPAGVLAFRDLKVGVGLV